MKKLIKIIAFSIATAALIFEPTFATIPNDDILDYFDQIGAYYYNPSGNNDLCNSSITKLSGNSTAEKIWNFFTERGYTDAQAAGILGNAKQESDFDITNITTEFWGLFQWGYGRKQRLFQKIAAAGLGKYTTPEYYGASNTIPADDFDKLLAVELEFAANEDEMNWQSEIKKQDRPEVAAEVFLTLFERAVNGQSEILYYGPFIGAKYQHSKQRRDYAIQYYKEFSGRGTSLTGDGGLVEKGKTLSIIGDSIVNRARSSIKSVFPSIADEDINAVDGRTWNEGIEAIKSAKLKKNVILELGTNSPNLKEDDLKNLILAIGNDHNMIFVTNFAADNADYYNSNNALFEKYAKQYSDITIADWKNAVSASPDTYMQDRLHPNEAGNKLFADTLYDSVNSSFNSKGCSISSEFTSLVKAYAWADWHEPPYTSRMPAYANAVTQSISEGRYVGGSINGIPGIDCGGFVTVLVQNSGIAPNYNNNKGNTSTQEDWVKAHGWILLNGSENKPIDTSILQPGDVAFSVHHTFIYVGEITGFNSLIASASYSSSRPRAPMAGKEDLVSTMGTLVRWYRNPAYSTHSTIRSNYQ